MVQRARALYDFRGEANTAEMSISAGEILEVTRQDIGDGWWEGSNSSGRTGLFPASYVELITTTSSAPPMAPPPILPQQNDDYWGAEQQGNEYEPNNEEAWDDDWDDDTYSEIGPVHNNNTNSHQNDPPSRKNYSLAESESISSMNNDHRTVGARKSVPKISFVKSGGDSYIYGTLNVNVPDDEKIFIHVENESFYWPQLPSAYSVVVASPKKESKLKGLKSYIAYQLTPSFNNIQVSRRYKHFDWLHERLAAKFCLIPIPPLPDKQISGRYEEQFIENRRMQLQLFVDWICTHPVLSRCEVWQHFLTCTDEKRWKPGKRNAEKDPLTGANSCVIFEAPEKQLLPSFVDLRVDKFTNFIHSMDISVKNLYLMAAEETKRFQGVYKRENQKIGEYICSLGASLELDEEGVIPTTQLTDAIKKTGVAYIDIGRMMEDQPKYDWDPLSQKMYLYRGLTSSFQDSIIPFQKSAVQKRKECEKLTSDQKMEIKQLNEISRRVDVINYALLAEMNHFKERRNEDLKEAMKLFLRQQINFYQKTVSKLENALALYE